MKVVHVSVLGAIIAGTAPSAATAIERRLSGSELLRAERCAGHYDCDEDGSWETGDRERAAIRDSMELAISPVRDCGTQDDASKVERACPVATHIKRLAEQH
jgi:hypothetical protein